MPDEIEAKLKVDDLAPVREKLTAAGATWVSKVRETNTYFEIVGEDAALRTRHEVDEAGKPRGRVTYKGPRRGGAFKTRQELEFDVSDASVAARLLELCGHRPVLVFEKLRETFTLDGCEVVLDELPILGTFVEVEGPDEPSIYAVVHRLGLNADDSLDQGYASMYAAAAVFEARLEK
jgi:adenylate cyclase class 2